MVDEKFIREALSHLDEMVVEVETLVEVADRLMPEDDTAAGWPFLVGAHVRRIRSSLHQVYDVINPPVDLAASVNDDLLLSRHDQVL
jgi:hypothetical protein